MLQWILTLQQVNLSIKFLSGSFLWSYRVKKLQEKV